MVRKWRSDYDNLCRQVDLGNGKKRKCRSGRKPVFIGLENIIFEWIAYRRAKSYVVLRADIQEFVLTMALQLDILREDFKASQHLLDNYFQRYELSLRRSTTLFKLEDMKLLDLLWHSNILLMVSTFQNTNCQT